MFKVQEQEVICLFLRKLNFAVHLLESPLVVAREATQHITVKVLVVYTHLYPNPSLQSSKPLTSVITHLQICLSGPAQLVLANVYFILLLVLNSRS